MAQEDCESDAVYETLAVAELVCDALPLKLEDSVGERDWDVDGVKEDENVALRDRVKDTVAHDVEVKKEEADTLPVEELDIEALEQALGESVVERDRDGLPVVLGDSVGERDTETEVV